MHLRAAGRLLIAVLGAALLADGLAAALLVAGDPPQRAGAIVVIGGDHKPERVRRAAELYRQGFAPLVILSAGTRVREGGEDMPEAEVLRRQALGLGIPAAALLIEDESQSTFQNAYYTRAILAGHGVRSILLVTSLFHSRRVGRIFRDVLRDGVRVYLQPAAGCALCWLAQPDQARVVAYETYNWARYWLGLRSSLEQPPPV